MEPQFLCDKCRLIYTNIESKTQMHEWHFYPCIRGSQKYFYIRAIKIYSCIRGKQKIYSCIRGKQKIYSCIRAIKIYSCIRGKQKIYSCIRGKQRYFYIRAIKIYSCIRGHYTELVTIYFKFVASKELFVHS